jgi:hypothetical protein
VVEGKLPLHHEKARKRFSFRFPRAMAVVPYFARDNDDCELLPSVLSVLAKKESGMKVSCGFFLAHL